MIQLKFKTVLFLLVFTGGICNQLMAANENPVVLSPAWKTEFTKTINKEFPISADGDVTLANKYGKIDLKTWAQNKVKIDIKISVTARKQSDADEIFERINIGFSNGADFVKAETTLGTQKKSWWNNGGKGEFKIEYTVHMPKSCNLNLSNKYGHATIAEIDGEAEIDVKYGDLQMDGVNNDCKITLGYGNGTILKSRDTEINVKYSKLNLKNASDIDVTSRYSKVYIDEAGDIKSSSKYDTYKLGNLKGLDNEGKYDNFEISDVRRVNATAKYSDFSIEKLRKEGDFSLEYGNLIIASLLENFVGLQLEGKYTDFKVITEKGMNYSLDVSARYADVSYPAGLTVTYEKDKPSNHQVKGYKGSQNASLIKVELEYGEVKIK